MIVSTVVAYYRERVYTIFIYLEAFVVHIHFICIMIFMCCVVYDMVVGENTRDTAQSRLI